MNIRFKDKTTVNTLDITLTPNAEFDLGPFHFTKIELPENSGLNEEDITVTTNGLPYTLGTNVDYVKRVKIKNNTNAVKNFKLNITTKNIF